MKIGGVAAVLACLALATGATGATPKYLLPRDARVVEGGRFVDVIVPQQEIKSDINPSNAALATGGGLIAALIDAKIQADRTKKAELEIEPVRSALAGFDADKLAKETTSVMLANAPWLQVHSVGFGRDDSIVGLSGALDASPAEKVLFVLYRYDLSPDFASVRVSARLLLASKTVSGAKAPTNRLDLKYLTYAQTVQSIVTLPSPAKDSTENASRWAADNAAMTRKALAIAFADMTTLIPRALDLSADDVKVMSKGERKVLGGHIGRLVEQGATGSLLFSDDLTYVQTIAH